MTSSDVISQVDYLNYVWDWGDGTNGTGQVTYHTYAQPGTYIVKLTATDPWLASNTMTSSVNVVQPAAYVASQVTLPTSQQLTKSPTASGASTASTAGGATDTTASARVSGSAINTACLLTVAVMIMMVM